MIPKNLGIRGVTNTSTTEAIANAIAIGIKYLTYLMNNGLIATSFLSKYLLISANDIEAPKEADITIAGSSTTPCGRIRSKL